MKKLIALLIITISFVKIGHAQNVTKDAVLGEWLAESKDGKVFVAWRGKTVTTLVGGDARRFLARVASSDEAGAQLAMAKATGNFKRDNERR